MKWKRCIKVKERPLRKGGVYKKRCRGTALPGSWYCKDHQGEWE